MTPDNLKTDFDEIFKGIIVPFFKDLGFKRKTQHFARQINDITQCSKKSMEFMHDSLSFTFNLGFYNKDIRSLAFGDKKCRLNSPKQPTALYKTDLELILINVTNGMN